MREKVQEFLESNVFQFGITALIALNALVLGLQTAPLPEPAFLACLIFDDLCLVVYVIEIILKLYAYGSSYFRDPWNVFDFLIVALSLVPTSIIPVPMQIGRVFRIFRLLRVFRLVSAFDQLRVLVEATLKAVPGVLWTAFLMLVVQYVYAIVGTSVFGDALPQYFGDLWRSIFTLFEVMTLEGWNGVADETMAIFPWAWAYFMTFVIIASFILMNVVVGVIVNSVDQSREEIGAVMDLSDGNDDALLDAKLEEMERLADEVGRLLADRKRRERRTNPGSGD